MIPKMRWLQERRSVAVNQVRAYMEKYEVSMQDAKRILQPYTEPLLQIFDEETQQWECVPFETVMVPYVED